MANLRLYHGTDVDSAHDLMNRGLDAAAAASYNSGGEFWATTALDSAEWFAESNPAGGNPAVFVFEVPEAVIRLLVGQVPPVAFVYASGAAMDYEFLPMSFADLNQSMCNQYQYTVACREPWACEKIRAFLFGTFKAPAPTRPSRSGRPCARRAA